MQRSIIELRALVVLALLCIADGAIVWSTVPTAQEEGLFALLLGIVTGLSVQELSLQKQRTMLYCGLIAALSMAATAFHVPTVLEFRTRLVQGEFPVPIEIVGGSMLLVLSSCIMFFCGKLLFRHQFGQQ